MEGIEISSKFGRDYKLTSNNYNLRKVNRIRDRIRISDRSSIFHDKLRNWAIRLTLVLGYVDYQ